MWGRIIANSEKLRVKCRQTRLKMGGFCGGRSLRSGRNGGRDSGVRGRTRGGGGRGNGQSRWGRRGRPQPGAPSFSRGRRTRIGKEHVRTVPVDAGCTAGLGKGPNSQGQGRRCRGPSGLRDLSSWALGASWYLLVGVWSPEGAAWEPDSLSTPAGQDCQWALKPWPPEGAVSVSK